MYISVEEEQISLQMKDGGELMKPPPVGSSPESIDELPPDSESVADSFSDANVVPEDEKNQLVENIKKLEDELVALRLKERSLNGKRKDALNKILDTKGSIRVFCRVRPFLSSDRRKIHRPISIESEKIVVRSGGSTKEFGFDKIFPQEASQDDVFVEVEPILRSALDGHNVCILAYGQTGTGKTFTMDGTNESPGIIPRVLEELFCQISLDSSTSYTFSISMLEVYVGCLRDLLAPKPSCKSYTPSRCHLNVQTDSKGTVEIEGLTDVPISNFTRASWWYAKGRRVRSTSWTNVNETSSRSHCLTRISIYRTEDASRGKAEVSKLWLVDLGGSERLLKTGATGQTLDEGRAINLSLSALGDVIAALRRKKGHVPYRNSKLTQILRDSVGDGSKVLMLVHVSPYEEDVGETTCSFTFAKRARAVECNRESSEDAKKQKEKKIADLEEKMQEAEEECKKLVDQIQKAEFALGEYRKFLSIHYPPSDDEANSPNSPKEYSGEILVTPKTTDKAPKRNATNSQPRFMSSTVASRQRKSTAEQQLNSKAKSSKSWARSSFQIPGSQSNSYSNPRFKAFMKNSSKKARLGETNHLNSEEDKREASDSKPSALQHVRMVASSDPNFKATLSHHRRRMSDLI